MSEEVSDWYVRYLRRRYRLFLRYVRRWRYWVRRIARVVRERVDPRAEVIAFGNVVVKGKATVAPTWTCSSSRNGRAS
ncbi:hypothetical protein [Methanopyrus sp.]